MSAIRSKPLRDEEGSKLPNNFAKQFKDVQSSLEYLKLDTEAIAARLNSVEKKADKTSSQLSKLTEKVGVIDERLSNIEKRVSRIEERLDRLEARMDNIETLLKEYIGITRNFVDTYNKHQMEILELVKEAIIRSAAKPD
jgi:chromosome segregation ATPase